MGGTDQEARFYGGRRWTGNLASFHLSYLLGQFKRTNKAVGNPLSESKHTCETIIFLTNVKDIMEEIPNKNIRYLRKMRNYWNLCEREYKAFQRV